MMLSRAQNVLEKFFEGQPSFSWDKVIIASSHGLVDEGDKVSFHFIVPGFQMTMASIKARLEAVDADGVFDRMPYSRGTQKLRAVGSIKTRADPRPLVLCGREPTRELLEASLVQLVAEDDVHLHFAPTAKKGRKRRRDPTRRPLTELSGDTAQVGRQTRSAYVECCRQTW